MGTDKSEAIARGTKAPVKAEAPKAEAPRTLDSYKAEVAAALASNDDVALFKAMKAMSSFKSEVAKAEAIAIQAEATQLAGAREKVAVALFQQIKKLGVADALKSVKATGFTFSLDMPDANGVLTMLRSVSLSVPSVKKSRGGGSSSIGKTKDEYGMSLGEVFEKFANAEERGKLAEAAKSEANPGTKTWQVKKQVKARAISEGLLKPIK